MEAEDDEDTIDEAGLGHCMMWGAERNPYGSLRAWRWSEVRAGVLDGVVG